MSEEIADAERHLSASAAPKAFPAFFGTNFAFVYLLNQPPKIKIQKPPQA